jgi:Tfp pilus assembly protein PilV
MFGKDVQIRKGFTVVEAMTAITMLALIVLGSALYRYWSSLDSRKAMAQATANRTGLFLLEAWRGSTDPNSFNPVSLKTSAMNIGNPTQGPTDPNMTSLLSGTNNALPVTVNGVSYFAALYWKNEMTYWDAFYSKWVKLRNFEVIIAFPAAGGASTYSTSLKQIKLTSYRMF